MCCQGSAREALAPKPQEASEGPLRLRFGPHLGGLGKFAGLHACRGLARASRAGERVSRHRMPGCPCVQPGASPGLPTGFKVGHRLMVAAFSRAAELVPDGCLKIPKTMWRGALWFACFRPSLRDVFCFTADDRIPSMWIESWDELGKDAWSESQLGR